MDFTANNFLLKCTYFKMFISHTASQKYYKSILVLRSISSRNSLYLCLSLTCITPRSLLSVRSSSECATHISCKAARSRDRSVLECSVVSGSSGTFFSKKDDRGFRVLSTRVHWKINYSSTALPTQLFYIASKYCNVRLSS